MGEAKIDITKIKEQINSRKQSVGATTEQKKKSRDAFLTELLHSRHTGQVTPATEKIRIVEKVSDKVVNGRVPAQHSARNIDPNLLTHVENSAPRPVQQYPEYQPVNEAMMPERENKYDEQINRLYNEYKNGNVANNTQQYTNQFGMLTEQQVAQIMAQNNGRGLPQNGLITEQVNTAINGFINDNMGVIVEQAMKNVVMEMYSIERIKRTLDENRDLIQNIVIDTIKMLSDRKKAQAAKSGN